MLSKKLSIGIVGSTGSIGLNVLKVLNQENKKFKINFLSCNKNYRQILQQIRRYCPKYVLVNDLNIRNILKKKKFKKKIFFLNSLNELDKIFKKNKIRFSKIILAAPSIEGLSYSFSLIKYCNEMLVANKESLVCGGDIFLKKARQSRCKITSIDSEHYCLNELLKNESLKDVSKIYLTASGGPFLNNKKKLYTKTPLSKVINHPTWKMGLKISVDSSTMVNKILEIIEAHVLFKIDPQKIKIKIHKESLAHAALVLNNGLVKIIIHDTSMTIPIRNSLFDKSFDNNEKNYFTDSKKFILSFDESSLDNYDIIKTGYKVLKLGHVAWILFNVINDKLVNDFLAGKIYFYQIVEKLIKIFKKKYILDYCNKKIDNISDIQSVINFGKKILENYEKN